MFHNPKAYKIRGWILVLCLIPLWEILRIGGNISDLLMPSIITIMEALFSGLFGGTLVKQVGLSLFYILSGTFAALLLAGLTLWITSISATLTHSISILSSLFHPLPGIVLLPVIILWVGIGPMAVIVIIIHSVFWPVLTNLQAGYRSIPQTWTMVAKNYQIKGFQSLFTILIPATFPYLLAGLRIAWARAWRALISAEMLFGAVAGAGGLGWFIHSKRVFMDSPGLFAGILVIMIVGSVVETLLFTGIENRTIRRWGMSL